MPRQQTQGLGGGMDAGGQAGHGRQVFQRRAGVRIAPQARTADQRGVRRIGRDGRHGLGRRAQGHALQGLGRDSGP